MARPTTVGTPGTDIKAVLAALDVELPPTVLHLDTPDASAGSTTSVA